MMQTHITRMRHHLATNNYTTVRHRHASSPPPHRHTPHMLASSTRINDDASPLGLHTSSPFVEKHVHVLPFSTAISIIARMGRSGASSELDSNSRDHRSCICISLNMCENSLIM